MRDFSDCFANLNSRMKMVTSNGSKKKQKDNTTKRHYTSRVMFRKAPIKKELRQVSVSSKQTLESEVTTIFATDQPDVKSFFFNIFSVP